MNELAPRLIGIGAVLGLVFSATTAAVPVWLAQVTMRRGPFIGVRASFAIAASQAFWAMVAAAMLFTMGSAYAGVAPGFRAGAICVLLYMAQMALQAPRLTKLHAEDLPDDVVAFTLRRAFWMPMRLPGFLALIIAVNLPLRAHGPAMAVRLALGVGIGCLLWCTFFAAVAWFGREVPEPVCVRSLNKLRTLSVIVLVCLAVIAFVPYMLRA